MSFINISLMYLDHALSFKILRSVLIPSLLPGSYTILMDPFYFQTYSSSSLLFPCCNDVTREFGETE